MPPRESEQSNTSSYPIDLSKNCFPEYGKGLAANFFTALTVSIGLAMIEMLLDTVAYLVYCVAINKDDLIRKTEDFAMFPLVGTFVFSLVVWMLFYSGFCCVNLASPKVVQQISTALLLSTTLLFVTAVGALINQFREVSHSDASMEDFMYAKLLSIGAEIVGLVLYIACYGSDDIHQPIFNYNQSIRRKFDNFFGIDCDETCCCSSNGFFGGSSSNARYSALRSTSSEDNADGRVTARLMEEGGVSDDNIDGATVPEVSTVNPMQRDH